MLRNEKTGEQYYISAKKSNGSNEEKTGTKVTGELECFSGPCYKIKRNLRSLPMSQDGSIDSRHHVSDIRQGQQPNSTDAIIVNNLKTG